MNNRLHFLLYIIVFFPLLLQAQNDSSSYIKDTTRAYDHFMEAEEFYTLAKYDSAIQYYEKASSIYQKLKLWANYIVSLSRIGASYNKLSQYERAKAYLDKALLTGLLHFGRRTLSCCYCLQ